MPGFPLDGGRVMRAAIWGATGNLQKATRWASNAGRGFAWLLIAAGIAMVLGVRVPVFGTGLVGGLWLAMIGWFLHNAAIMSYRQLLVQVTENGQFRGIVCLRDARRQPRDGWRETTVGDVMTSADKTVTVSPDDDSVRALQLIGQHGVNQLPVVDNGRLRGLLRREDILRWLSLYGDSTRFAA